MRPVARPHHALGRVLHERSCQRADILVFRRAGLRGLVRRRELDPAAAGVDQPQQAFERRMVGRHRFQELAGVVDHELARQALDLRFVLRQLAAVELDIGVPAEGMHARHHFVHDLEAEHAAVQRHDAHRADASLGKALEFSLGDIGTHHRHAFGHAAQLLHRGQRDAVVVLVGVGLHDDHALEAEALLQRAILVDVEVSGQGSPRSARHLLVVEVHVRVGRAARDFHAGSSSRGARDAVPPREWRPDRGAT